MFTYEIIRMHHVSFLVSDSVQAVDQNMVLYLGCSIGGVVFLLLIVILFIFVCK